MSTKESHHEGTVEKRGILHEFLTQLVCRHIIESKCSVPRRRRHVLIRFGAEFHSGDQVLRRIVKLELWGTHFVKFSASN